MDRLVCDIDRLALFLGFPEAYPSCKPYQQRGKAKEKKVSTCSVVDSSHHPGEVERGSSSGMEDTFSFSSVAWTNTSTADRHHPPRKMVMKRTIGRFSSVFWCPRWVQLYICSESDGDTCRRGRATCVFLRIGFGFCVSDIHGWVADTGNLACFHHPSREESLPCR